MPRGILNSNPLIKPAEQRCRIRGGGRWLCRCFKTCIRDRKQDPLERRQKIEQLIKGETVPCETLASTFGVDVRTIYRDIAAMRKAGIPVEGCAGHAGGITIRKRYCAPRTGMVG